MQSKIARPVKYNVTSIGDKVQRRGIVPANNKNNKDISIFSVTQHQLSIIVKHKHKKKALLRNGKIHILKHPLLPYNGSKNKNYQNVFKDFVCRLRSYGMLFHDICWPVISRSPRAVATGSHHEKPILPKIMRPKKL